MSTGFSIGLGLAAAGLFCLGRQRWALALLPGVVGLWLLPTTPLYLGLLLGASVLLYGAFPKLQPKPSASFVKPGTRGVVVVDVLPHSDMGVVKAAGRLWITHGNQPLAEGTEVRVLHTEGDHAGVEANNNPHNP